jgi:Iron/manganese superoxide dismutases, alpha-hairpin domain
MSCNEAQAENPALREGTVMAVYTLPDLPYDYAGLEPVISGEILERLTGPPVRGRPWKTRGYTDCPGGPAPSAIRPWTPQHSDPQRDKMTHHGTKKNSPPSREHAASGLFTQVVAGVGFEPT